MKRLLLMFAAAAALISCSEVEVDINATQGKEPVGDNIPTLNISFEDDDTRIELNEATKTVWSKGDLVSVFYKSATYQQWQFKGETGDRSGVLAPVGATEWPAVDGDIVVVYPDNAEYSYNTANKSLTATIPAEQTYRANSYGDNGNMLVAYSTSQDVKLKNVYGWLKIPVKGEGSVKSITFKGNNMERVAGKADIDVVGASATFQTSSAPITAVTLNCGEGVALTNEPTVFYIGLMPQSFEKGITIEIETIAGGVMTKSTDKRVAIERNVIQPMGVVEFAADDFFPANNEFWYGGSEAFLLYGAPFDVNIVKHEAREVCSNGQCTFLYVMECDGDITTINQQAFYNEYLTSVYIPNSVTAINQAAFLKNERLKEVHIGTGIQTIGMGAFTNCAKLENIYLRATTPPTLGDYALMRDNPAGGYLYIGCIIYVPKEALNAYKEHNSWKQYADYIFPFDYVAGERVEDEDAPSSSAFNHRLLVIDNTGVSCSFCPIVTDRLLALSQSEYATYYNEVQVHGGYYASGDPAYSAAAADVDAFYGPTGYPDVRINFYGGKVDKGNSDNIFVNSTMAGVFNSYRKSLGADAGIAITTSISGSTITIDADVKSAKTQTYHITAWVLENNISSPNQNGATADYHTVYHHALRYIAGSYDKYSDLSGENLGEIAKGEVGSKRFTVPVSSSWNTSNLEVLVIASAKNANGYFEVVNTALCPMNATKDYEYINDNNGGGDDNNGGGDSGDNGGDDSGDVADAIELTSFVSGGYNSSYWIYKYILSDGNGKSGNYLELYVNDSDGELNNIKNGEYNYVTVSSSGNKSYFSADTVYVNGVRQDDRINGERNTVTDGTLRVYNGKITLSLTFKNGVSHNFTCQIPQ